MLQDALLAGVVALHLVALPVFLIALADTNRRADRLRFGVAFLFAALATAALVALNLYVVLPRFDPEAPHIGPILLREIASVIWLCIYGWFGWVTVRRLNDIGRPKKLAFLLLIPYVNVGLATYLLFARPRRTQPPSAAPERTG